MSHLLVLLAVVGIFDPAPKTREYPVFVERCYDADTCTVTLDLGVNVLLASQKIRLYGIDAFEMRGEEKPKGIVARDWLWAQVKDKSVVVLIVQKKNRFGMYYDAKGKYGRWLAILMVGDRNLNEELVTEGHAVEAEY